MGYLILCAAGAIGLFRLQHQGNSNRRLVKENAARVLELQLISSQICTLARASEDVVKFAISAAVSERNPTPQQVVFVNHLKAQRRAYGLVVRACQID